MKRVAFEQRANLPVPIRTLTPSRLRRRQQGARHDPTEYWHLAGHRRHRRRAQPSGVVLGGCFANVKWATRSAIGQKAYCQPPFGTGLLASLCRESIAFFQLVPSISAKSRTSPHWTLTHRIDSRQPQATCHTSWKNIGAYRRVGNVISLFATGCYGPWWPSRPCCAAELPARPRQFFVGFCRAVSTGSSAYTPLDVAAARALQWFLVVRVALRRAVAADFEGVCAAPSR